MYIILIIYSKLFIQASFELHLLFSFYFWHLALLYFTELWSLFIIIEILFHSIANISKVTSNSHRFSLLHWFVCYKTFLIALLCWISFRLYFSQYVVKIWLNILKSIREN